MDDLELLAGDGYGVYTMKVALEELEERFPKLFDALKTARPDDVELVMFGDPREDEWYWEACDNLEHVELPGGYYLRHDLDVWLGTADALDEFSW